jgi:hypothetical protein
MHLGILFNIELLNTWKRKSFQIDFQEHPELLSSTAQKRLVGRVKKQIQVEHGFFVYELGIVFYNRNIERRAKAAQSACMQYDGISRSDDKKRWRCVQHINNILELTCKVSDIKVEDNFRVVFLVVKSGIGYMFMSQMCARESQKENLLLRLYGYRKLLDTFDADSLQMVCSGKNDVEAVVVYPAQR